MPRSVFSNQYTAFLRELRELRSRAGMTQGQLAEKLQTTQSHISKCERGERRVDIVELWQWCRALDVPLREFAARLEAAFSGSAHKGRSRN